MVKCPQCPLDLPVVAESYDKMSTHPTPQGVSPGRDMNRNVEGAPKSSFYHTLPVAIAFYVCRFKPWYYGRVLRCVSTDQEIIVSIE